MRRAATTLAAALALAPLAACSDPATQDCPGEPVARFRFTGSRVSSGDPALAGLDPAPEVPDCTGDVGPPPFPAALPPFEGLLSADPSTEVAALCRPSGIVLFGRRSGSRYAVEGSTVGAVLASCSPGCAAGLRLVVAGDVTGGAAGAPLAFQGVLVEIMSHVAGDCGTCPLAPSCAARYAVDGAL